MKKRLLILLSLASLWLAVANSTCDTRVRQEELINSYHLARFQLNECRHMGAEQLNPGRFDEAVQLSEDLDGMLTEGKWLQASKTIPHLQQTLDMLLERLKEWDPDGDGLSNYAEFMLHGTSWSDSDSDGDGYLDGSEIFRHQTDPLDYCGVPIGVAPETSTQQPCPALEKLR